ncbi:MFS sugar transporter-like protein [Umbelopsis sp. PMI_123]|nr:MFS sugar transporter-like protein [Umbelopsis sp. PMI_123]
MFQKKKLDNSALQQEKGWATEGGMLKLYWYSAVLIVNSAINGYDGSMMNGLQVLDTWAGYFNYPSDSQLGLLNAIQQVGGIVALPFAFQATDRLGRRLAIMIGSLIVLLGVGLQGGSTQVGMFIGARFLIGFGTAISGNAAPTLIVELSHPKQRGTMTGIYNSSWYLGSIIAAWTTFGTFYITNEWSWRIPSILQGLFSLIQVIFIFTLPESPRWLVSRKREEEALQILAKLHGNGDPNNELVQFEYREIVEAIRLEQQASNRSWLELVNTPGNRKRSFLVVAVGFFSQWSGNGLVSYYINKVLTQIGITNTVTKFVINGVLQIFNLFAAYFGSWLIERVGRRPLFLIATSGMLVSFAIWTGLAAHATSDGNSNSSIGSAFVAFIFIYYFFYDIAWSPLTVAYPVEILPFSIRAKGMALSSFAVNLALFFNSYVNPIALAAIDWKYYLVYVIWIMVELIVVYFFFVETSGYTLEELIVVFDGEGAELSELDRAAIALENEKANTPLPEKTEA